MPLMEIVDEETAQAANDRADVHAALLLAEQAGHAQHAIGEHINIEVGPGRRQRRRK